MRETLIHLAHEVAGGVLGVLIALVVESDPVRERRVAEEDRHGPTGRIFGPVRPAEDVGVVRVVTKAPGALEHSPVRGNPLEPHFGEVADHRLADRSLPRPHAPRHASELLRVGLHGSLHLGGGILGTCEASRARGCVAIDRRRVRVGNEREDRVEEGGGGDLDLAAVLKHAMERHDVAQDLRLLAHHGFEVCRGEARLLLDPPPHGGYGAVRERDVPLLELRREPGPVEPHLEIPQIRRREALSIPPLLEELAVAGPRVDLRVPAGVEEGS